MFLFDMNHQTKTRYCHMKNDSNDNDEDDEVIVITMDMHV